MSNENALEQHLNAKDWSDDIENYYEENKYVITLDYLEEAAEKDFIPDVIHDVIEKHAQEVLRGIIDSNINLGHKLFYWLTSEHQLMENQEIIDKIKEEREHAMVR